MEISDLTPAHGAKTPAAGQKSHRRRRTVIIRGDLFSDTGYSRAIRALAAVLCEHCDVIFGVSLYEDARRRQNTFNHIVIGEEDIPQCVSDGGEVIIVNVCLPEHFYYAAGAINVGYFFWETEKFPPTGFWLAKLKSMDRVWAPSSWQSNFMREITGRVDIPVIPWPQVAAATPDAVARARLAPVRAHHAMTLDELRNYHLRASPPGMREVEKVAEQRAFESGVNHRFDPGRSPSVTEILNSHSGKFLAVQTDAPRKGLPILLTSWLLFKRRPEGKRAKLLIKLSSLDVGVDLFRIHFHASLAVRRAKERFGVAEPGVSFIYDRLDNEQLEALLASSDALISATYGEGFGGPIAEALTHGVPVIAPDHSSLHDLLGDDYPLAVRSEGHALELWQNISVYSSSSIWHLPDESHFADQMAKFAAMSRKARKQMGLRTRDGLLRRTGFEAASRLVAEEFERISQLGIDAGAVQSAPPASSSSNKLQ